MSSSLAAHLPNRWSSRWPDRWPDRWREYCLSQWSALLFCLLLPPAVSLASECTSDVSQIDRGERLPVKICAPKIPRDFRLDGLSNSGISVEYSQWLKRCSPDSRDRGIFLWLSASSGAHSAALRITDAKTDVPVCAPLAINVPPRAVLGTSTLKPVRHPDPNAYRLDIRATDLISLANACDAGLEFPASARQPDLKLADQPDALQCSEKRIRALVHVRGQQRDAAKVIVRDLGGSRAGESAVAMARLPDPDWLAEMPDEQAKYVDAAGYRTRYFEQGRGRDTMILLHGGQPDPISPTARHWRQNFSDLSRRFRVIAYDNLAHGETDGLKSEADYGRYYEFAAQHLSDFIDALGLERVHLVGHSQGGWPVMRVALDRPDVIKCVVSVATVLAPFRRDSRGVRNFAYLLTSVVPREPTRESLMLEREFISYSMNNLFWSDVDATMLQIHEPRIVAAKNAMAKVGMSPGHPDFRRLRDTALDEIAAGKLRVPHLVLWGRNDPMADYELGLEFYDKATAGPARTDFHVFNAAGHSPMVEYPERFSEAVASFCGEYRSL